MYAAAFLEHFQHPRGQGSLTDATHTAERQDAVCGDVLALDLRVEDGRVAAARFRARGCAGAIAVGSALATLLPGRAARPRTVSRDDLVAELGRVPAGKRHALRLALHTLEAALAAPTAARGRTRT